MALRPDDVKRPTNLRVRRFIAKYILWLEVMGYLFVVLIGATIAALWLIKVDDIAKAATSGPIPQLKPFMEEVSWPKECAIVELLTPQELTDEALEALGDAHSGDTRRDVKKGEPLLTLTDDPAAVQKFKDAAEWQKLIDEVDKLSAAASATDTVIAARNEAERRLAKWKEEQKGLATKTLRAPLAGMLNGAKPADLEGKVFAADAKMFSIVDFTDIRIPVKVLGANVSHGRLLQEAKFTLKDNYGDKEIVRVDVNERGKLGRRRLELLDPSGETLQTAEELFEDETLTVKRDLAFKLQDVVSVEVLARSEVERLRGQSSDDPQDLVTAELFHDKEFRAQMIDGYHHVKVKLTRLTEEQRSALMDCLNPAVQGKATTILDPEEGDKELQFRLGELRNPKFLITMVLRQPRAGAETTKEIAKRLKREGAIQCDQLERFYQGTLRVLDPPEYLQQEVRRLFLKDTPKYLEADVEWIVDKRRIAMLLFRQ